MGNFDQLKAMNKMLKWVRKKETRKKENLKRNLARKKRRRRLDKIAKQSRRRNR